MATVFIRRVDHAEIGASARSLASAFYDDPVCRFAWPDDGKRRARAQRVFTTQINALWGRREVDADPDFGSVAVWAPADRWQFPTSAVARFLLTATRTHVRIAALLAYLRTDALHPAEPHRYLELLGTVPDKQGRGLGGHVMAAGLDRADEEGVPIWTWSSNPRNLAFYQRHDFVVLDELPFAPGGPSIYPIRREPR